MFYTAQCLLDVLSGYKNVRNVIQMAIFFKNHNNRSAAGGLSVNVQWQTEFKFGGKTSPLQNPGVRLVMGML